MRFRRQFLPLDAFLPLALHELQRFHFLFDVQDGQVAPCCCATVGEQFLPSAPVHFTALPLVTIGRVRNWQIVCHRGMPFAFSMFSLRLWNDPVGSVSDRHRS